MLRESTGLKQGDSHLTSTSSDSSGLCVCRYGQGTLIVLVVCVCRYGQGTLILVVCVCRYGQGTLIVLVVCVCVGMVRVHW